jgi:hypothetical protein
MIKRYDSTAALRASYIALGCRRGNSGSEWYGGETENDTLRKAELGDTSLVPQAEKVLDQLNRTIDTPRKMWEPAMVGAYYAVPDVIAGRPMSMRQQITTQDEVSPITVLVVTTSSAGIAAETLAKRGTVILALVMALSRVRPVTLQALCCVDGYKDNTGETIITSEINTHPLDLATACYVLTSAGFARRLTYGLATELNHFRGGWPKGFTYSAGGGSYYDKLIPRLVSDPSRCLLIEAARLNDHLLVNPTEWLNNQITKFTSNEEETV